MEKKKVKSTAKTKSTPKAKSTVKTKAVKTVRKQTDIDMSGYVIITCLLIACGYFIIILA